MRSMAAAYDPPAPPRGSSRLWQLLAATGWLLSVVLLLVRYVGPLGAVSQPSPAPTVAAATHAAPIVTYPWAEATAPAACAAALGHARATLDSCEQRAQRQQQRQQRADLPLPAWVTADVLHTKLFSSSLPPVRLQPYWMRSPNPPPAAATFSVTTILTPDRLPALARLCRRWGGPISAALHWNPATAASADAAGPRDEAQLRQEVQALLGTGDCTLDVHLIVDTFPLLQLNYWRNVARLYAPTAHYVMLDVDFLPDAGLREALERDRDRWVGWLSMRRVLVLPAFELTVTAAAGAAPTADQDGDGYGSADAANPLAPYPATKPELLAAWAAGDVRVFHPEWYHGQGHTNYSHWRTATAPYQPSTYHFKWEPYVVGGPATPWCDEGFYGYGSNKCACIVEMFMAGYEFWVLPDHFVVHQPHADELALVAATDASVAARVRAREKRRARENERNFQTLRRFLDALEIKYGQPAPIVLANQNAAIRVDDPTAIVLPPAEALA